MNSVVMMFLVVLLGDFTIGKHLHHQDGTMIFLISTSTEALVKSTKEMESFLQ